MDNALLRTRWDSTTKVPWKAFSTLGLRDKWMPWSLHIPTTKPAHQKTQGNAFCKSRKDSWWECIHWVITGKHAPLNLIDCCWVNMSKRYCIEWCVKQDGLRIIDIMMRARWGGSQLSWVGCQRCSSWTIVALWNSNFHVRIRKEVLHCQQNETEDCNLRKVTHLPSAGCSFDKPQTSTYQLPRSSTQRCENQVQLVLLVGCS